MLFFYEQAKVFHIHDVFVDVKQHKVSIKSPQLFHPKNFEKEQIFGLSGA